MKPVNKARISFIIHTSYDKNYWHNFAYELLDSGIDAGTVFYPNKQNYMDKIYNASKTNLPYSISLDEDVIIGNHGWDNFLESTKLLDNIDSLLVSPLVSTEVGITHEFIGVLLDKWYEIINTDNFDECNLNNELNNITDINLYFGKILLKANFTDVGKIWGVDYTGLHKYTINAKDNYFEKDKFYEDVKKIRHYYKGIHPLRVLPEAQMFLAELIIENYDSFVKKRKYSEYPEGYISNRPYFTNHCFMIKTNVWRSVLNRKDLMKDEFDEVQLNLFKEKNNMNIVFQNLSLAIHPTYNTIGIEDQIKIEDYLIEELNAKINKS